MKYFGSKKVYQHFRERVRVSEKGFCCAVTLGHQKRGNFGLFDFGESERANEVKNRDYRVTLKDSAEEHY